MFVYMRFEQALMWNRNMTKQVIVTPTGKVKGIRGLYKTTSSNRFYVRYACQGVDRQLTIHPKNQTFSGLEKAARKGLTELKKLVRTELPKTREYVQASSQDTIANAQDALSKVIIWHWGKRGCCQRQISRLLCHTRDMCLCSTQDVNINTMLNAHNLNLSRQAVENDASSNSLKHQKYKDINNVFTELIRIGSHHGSNPTLALIRPKAPQTTRTAELTFEDAAKVIAFIRKDETADSIKRAEAELVLRLCMETGQRPNDIHRWNLLNLTPDRHYQFESHKTGTKHRVNHLISKTSQALAMTIVLMRGGVTEYGHKNLNRYTSDTPYMSFWRYTSSVYGIYINSIIHRLVGADKVLYSARHFFISEVFRMTESEFWAEVFTHEGRTANTKHYLHPDQQRADAILTEISRRLDAAIELAA